ncbi:MAG: tetratricopeptide repeat protein [Deltaproteobacteria bacterium]|nr:tetratricopeptide repeat protein [Deltaproteobacteria bacterium]
MSSSRTSFLLCALCVLVLPIAALPPASGLAAAGPPAPSELSALHRARELLAAGKPDQAERALLPVAGEDAHPLVDLLLGKALAALGRNQEAAERFGRAAEKDPGLWQAQAALGHAYLALDEPVAAAAAFERAHAASGGNPDLLLAAGHALERAKDPEQAAGIYQKVLDQYPEHAVPAQEGLARSLLAANRPGDALPHLRGLAQEEGESARPWRRVLVSTLARCGRTDEALSLAGRYAAADPGGGWWRVRSRLYLEENDPEGALACLLAAGYLTPLKGREAILAGDLAREAGAPSLAAQLYADRTQGAAGPELYLKLSHAWMQAKEPETALQWAREGESLFPDPRLAALCASLLWELERWPEAAAAWERAAAGFGEPGRAWTYAAWAHFRAENRAAAAKALDKALSLGFTGQEAQRLSRLLNQDQPRPDPSPSRATENKAS